MAGVDGLPSTFTTGQARAIGVQSRDLYRARDEGELLELSRGVFRKVSAPTPTYPDLLAVAVRAPRAVVCLLSAALVHELSDELPLATQIAVPRGTWRPVIAYPPVEVFRWDPETFEIGIDTVTAAEGEEVRVYSAARTVADLIRLRNRIGEPVAHAAIQRFVRSRRTQIGELMSIATSLDIAGPTRAALDVLTAS